MAVSEKRKTTRLYQVAKEFNVSHDSLVEFLTKKGFKVKNHMSSVTDVMYEALERQYRKDRVEAERHAIKRKEYDEQDRKRRGEDKPEHESEFVEETVEPAVVAESTELIEEVTSEPDTVEAEQEDEPSSESVEAQTEEKESVEQTEVAEMQAPEAEVVETKEPVAAETEEDTASKTDEVEAEAEVVEAEAPEAEVVQEEMQMDEPEVAAEPVEAKTEKPDVPVAAKEEVEPAAEVEETVKAEKEPEAKKDDNVSIQSSMPKMGLKVKGKIELEPKRPKKVAKGKKTKDGDDAAKPKDATKDTDKDGDRSHKKKKKKKIVAVKTEQPGDKANGEAARGKKKKKGSRREVDAAEVNEAIKRTIASMGDFGSSGRSSNKKKKRARRQEVELREHEEQERKKTTISVYEYATVSELAGLMNVNVAAVISSLIGLGVMASINQRLDLETIELIASEYGFDVEKEAEFEVEALEDIEDQEETLEPRPPIVTIMGHVDHGKTSLLDYIRNANVVAGESGGITQHIGAYTVSMDDGRRITFLDTPGHEAFTAMRARGAQATDIVVLVVAADDSVMPQTVEAISHAQAAQVPIVIAINKVDKPESNPERIKQQLAERNVLVEDWGGKVGCVEVSAKKGLNIDDLMERILLESDILELKANPARNARGVIVEAQLDKGRGVVATVIVQKGTLKIGDSFVAGNEYGKVRAMMDERDNRVEEVPPSTPVVVLGFDSLPQAGDTFVAVDSDREAREIASVRHQIKRETDFRSVRRTTLDDISEQIKLGGVQDLAIIVKGDVDGSVEALADSLLKLSTDEVRIAVIHKSVGAISESDVLLAAASSAIIIGFHVRPNLAARKLAEAEKVDIRLYEIIYDAISDVKNALEGMLRPEISEKIVATIVVRDIFKISKIGTIAGCLVQEGKIHRNKKVRLVRDGLVVFTGNIDSLKRFKDDAKEVDQGFECGISLDGFNDIKVDDVIEAFEIVETKRQLS
jgi:translation initiation factor IF-2